MRYEGPIYAPGPVEHGSYMLQVTMGCSHNRCRFCNFFKQKPFRVRPYAEVEEDILMARQYYKHVPAVYLLDGNPLCLSSEKLLPILRKIREVFPESAYTRMYARFSDVLRRNVNELKELKTLGVDMLYTSLESGSDLVLNDICKGFCAADAVEASRRLQEAEILYSTTIILGLGGVKNSADHVRGSIEALNQMKAPFLSLSCLSLQTDAPLYEDYVAGRFQLPTYRQIFQEEKAIFEGISYAEERPVRFYSGIFLPYNGTVSGLLPYDKDRLWQVVKNRENQYSAILDKQLFLNGAL